MIKGFEDAVRGMEKGEEKFIKLSPSEAYGEHNPELVRHVPRDQLPKEELKPGMMLLVVSPDGSEMPAEIIEVSDKTVSIDLNHPMAGKTLNFKFKVVDIIST